jgi:capsular polysaccharide biosynthesis protein
MPENSSTQGFEFSSVKLIGFIVKWWKPIAIVTFATAVISAGASFLIKDKFQSTVIMFPSTTHSISKALIDVQGASKADLLEFGMEEDADQMVQILNSDEIFQRIVQKFDLLKHYDIDPSGKLAQTKLRKEYEGNISFKRTEYLSVRVDVMDEDPQMAADIANEIAAQLDTVKNRMQKERAREGLYIVQTEFDEQSAFIKSMEDSLKAIRMKGINDYESQAEVLNKEYATALARGDQRAIKALEEKLDILSEYGGEYVALKEGLELYREQLSLLKVKLKEATVDATQPISHKFVVNHAYKAEKKM